MRLPSTNMKQTQSSSKAPDSRFGLLDNVTDLSSKRPSRIDDNEVFETRNLELVTDKSGQRPVLTYEPVFKFQVSRSKEMLEKCRV